MINGLTDTMQRNKVFEDPLKCYSGRLEVSYHDFTRSYGLLDCISFSWEKNLRRSIFHYSIGNSDLFFAFKYTPHLAVFLETFTYLKNITPSALQNIRCEVLYSSKYHATLLSSDIPNPNYL